MLQYESFENSIKAVSGKLFAEWRHLLPAVPLAFRHRFLETVKKGFTLAKSFDMIMLSQTLADAAYEEFVNQAMAAKMQKEKGSVGTSLSNNRP